MNTNNAPIASNASSSNSPAPAKSFRLGRIKAAVWANETDGKTFYNVTFSRTYVGKIRSSTGPARFLSRIVFR